MEQYDMTMGNKIQKKFIDDFQSKNKVVKCVSTFCWEKQFKQVYTNSIFKLFQEQINRMMYCQVIPSEEISNEIGVNVIKVLERSIVNDSFLKEYTYTVSWMEIGEHISCNCRNSNSKEYCVVTFCWCWPKRIFKPLMRGGYPHMTKEYKKFQEVEKFFQQCIEVAMGSPEKLEFIKESCNEMKNALVNWVPTTSDNVQPSQTTENTQVGRTSILNPVITATRGRPRTNQYRSHAEEHSRGCVRRNHTSSGNVEDGGEGRGRRPRGRGLVVVEKAEV
ncbi:hypothetical protein ACS0TY_018681 [Phlomoides rotata]